MTAYELFKKVHYHHTGQFVGKIYKFIDNPKDHVVQSFINEEWEMYSIEFRSGFLYFEYGKNEKTEKISTIELLQSIEVMAGYWLCCYDGHTGEWMLIRYGSKTEAKVAYKKRYMRYFRYQMWFWTVRIR